MSKTIFTFVTLFTIIFAACGDKTSGNADSANENEKYVELYKRSLAMKDFTTSIHAIQMILLTDSTNSLRDSLPELFGAISNLEACMLATEQAMIRHPQNEKFQKIMLVCMQQIGDTEGQFALLNNLYEKSGKVEYLIQIATIQLQGGQIQEASKMVDKLMREFKTSKDSIDVFIDNTKQQKVPLMAALWNMKGFIYMQQKNIDKAKEAYFKALEIYPEFEMPKNNLNMIFDKRMR